MDPYRWDVIQSTFDTLVELDDLERGNRLTALRNSDPELRAAVELMLAADSEVDARLAPLEKVFFTQLAPPADPLGLAGQTISHFQIGETIGAGGMGVVYRAEDIRLGRAVALKFLLPSHGLDTKAEARFFREAQVVAALDHPNLCAIHEVGITDDGRPFLAMPLYPGENLRARMTRDGPMHVSDVLAIAKQIAEGLECANGAGIVHRDLKPGNVMLLPDGTLKILDFGLAKAQDQSLTESGALFGTVSYMAPEQIRGEAADGRADLWALGVIVYEMLTARKPFGGEQDIAIAHAILHDAPIPITMQRGDLSAALEDLVHRLLQKDPARRYETASELLTELAKVDSAGAGKIGSLRTRLRRARRTVFPTRTRIMTAFGAVVGASGLFAWSTVHRDPMTVGNRALENFDLGQAEVEFARAARQKPDNASARLWLAQAMMLNERPAADWKQAVTFAAGHRRELAPSEQKRLDALTAFSSELFPSACEQFAEVADAERRTNPDAYEATVALADCLREDEAVIPAPESPSGYKFRTSFNRVESLYRAVLEQNSTIPAAYAVLLPRLHRILPTEKSKFRRGIGTGPIKGPFLSLPALAGDTIAYVPYVLSATGDWRTRDPNALDAALARNRSRLREWSIAWAKAAPRDPDAHAFLGGMLEATGELVGGQHAALDEIRLARSLARETSGRSPTRLRDLRLGTGEVRLWLRLGRFDKAAALADTLLLDLRVPAELDEKTQSEIAETLSTIATLRGRFKTALGLEKRFAAEYRVRLNTGELLTLPPAIGADAITLVAYSSFGVEPDSIATIAERITQKTKSLIAPAKAASVRDAILTRSFALAAPVIGPGSLASLGSNRDILVRAVRFLANNDRVSARRLSDSLVARHSEYAPGEITMDAVYQDAWLRTAVGDSVGAASLLDNALRGLSVALPSILANPVEAACLVRATILRAELAASMRRPAIARTRAAEAYQLWGRGDPVISASLARIADLR